MEREIFAQVRTHWDKLNPGTPRPNDFVLLKVQGKQSRKGCMVALVLDAKRRTPVVVVKVPRNPAYTRHVETEAVGLASVHGRGLGSESLRHVPWGTLLTALGGQTALLQSACRGYPMTRILDRREEIEDRYGEILEWMREFHSVGRTAVTLEGADLDAWVETPLREVEQKLPRLYEALAKRTKDYLSSLGSRVYGKTAALTRQHGDFNAHNLLLQEQSPRFFLVDWEDFSPCELPIHDLNHFFVSNSKVLGEGGDAQSTFRNALLTEGWYQDLYRDAVRQQSHRGVIEEDLFWQLTPLYFLRMCLRVTDEARDEGHTADVWARRADAFIADFPELRQ